MNPLDYVFGLEQFGIKLGLDNIRTLAAALGNPQLAYKTIVIAGTNGKGSVTAFVDEALRAAGHRVGRYTSPHLVRLEERFAYDGRIVATDQLNAVAARVVGTIAELLESGALHAPPTFFEATTAIGFALFKAAAVDIAVLEVGLGGRLDATNIAEPIAVAITSIDRDHEQQLGPTLASIAREKAGIIKPGAPVVVGPLVDEPLGVIEAAAAEREAPVVRALDGCRSTAELVEGTPELSLETPVRQYPMVRLGLRGRHQISNAIVAVRLLETVESLGVRVGPEAVRRGLHDARWPGRLDWIQVDQGALLLDAAHNPAGAQSLASYLSEVHPERLPLVYGAVKDKDIDGMLHALLPVSSRLIATQAATSRAATAADVAARARAIAPAMPIEEISDSVAAARAALHDSSRAVVAGSIFLIGEIIGRMQGSAERF
jgi:dihydrofolate synthase/folylpolyglutamate synthase